MKKKKILVTGGLGYIGSHSSVILLENNYDVIIIDNLCNSDLETLKNINRLTSKKPDFYKCDINNDNKLNHIFKNNAIDGIIHFAALKSVEESIEFPEKYYKNNVEGIKTLLKYCSKYNVNKFIFSSSCTVYGVPKNLPIKESSPFGRPLSPYGNTKKLSEEILMKFCKENYYFKNISLRYFNPIGAHKSNMIGENPKGIPTNLVPLITKNCIGKNVELKIFGNDYNTRDGTAIRDYIHIEDLAIAHLNAYKYLNKSKINYDFFNIGTGKGYSVLEVIKTFEKVSAKKLKYKFVKRRKGDIEKIYADTKKANKLLKWKAISNLDHMLNSAWLWEKKLNEIQKSLK